MKRTFYRTDLLWLPRHLLSLRRYGWLFLTLAVPAARAQFAVIDADAIYQLTEQVSQSAKMVQHLNNQYNQMKAMARQAQGLWRYRGPQNAWEYFRYADQYASVAQWALGVNSKGGTTAEDGYAANTVLARIDDTLSDINSGTAETRRTLYATRGIMDGNNTSAMRVVGSIRAAAQDYQNAIAELQSDADDADEDTQSELAVAQRTNAANLLLLRTSQDQLKLLTAMLEQQVAQSKLTRDTLAGDNNAALDLQRAAKDNSLWDGITDTQRNWNPYNR